MRCADKVLAKHAMRDAGLPTPDFYSFTETAFKELGAAEALGAIEERLEFPIVVKPADQGSALGVKFARSPPPTCPPALVAAFSYSQKVLLERHVHGRELAVSILGDEALPVVEAVPREEDFYDFSARYTIGRTAFVCPAELGRRADRARPGARARRVPPARLPRLRPGRPDARGAARTSSRCSRSTRSPG